MKDGNYNKMLLTVQDKDYTFDVYCRFGYSCYTTLHTWRPGFSCHWRQAVELTARRHHHCNISVDFSAQTENIFISPII